MITGHCLLTITLLLNTLNQEMEDYFNVPHSTLFLKFFANDVKD